MNTLPYDRLLAIQYAREWALRRNPAYMDFSPYGGDCTSFCSQCLYAGTHVMNFTPDTGWYYLAPGKYAPAWSGVKFFHRFLTQNWGIGPFGRAADLSEVLPGDFIQLGNGVRFYHTLFVLSNEGGEITIATHTQDSLDRPLSSYSYVHIRSIHILGARG
jgi:hypothetical protein